MIIKNLNTKRFDLDAQKSPLSKMPSKPERQKGIRRFLNIRSAVIGIFVLQILTTVLLIIIIRPSLVFEQASAVGITNKVSELVSVPPSEVPVIARVGDGRNLTDIETLKSQNEVNAEVYKDAQNGDYVLAYTSKMIIYRAGENRIIYEGRSPQKILEDTQNSIINAVVTKAKKANLIPQDSTETPQVALVSDPNALKSGNPQFYAEAQQNDIVVTFPRSSIVILYRPSNDLIINSGSFSTVIR